MLCKRPSKFRKVSSEAAFPCGQCVPCRINQRRIWSHRLVLESLDHPTNTFLTVTYDDDHLPGEFFHPKTGEVFAPYSVNPEHHRLFINNLRWHMSSKLGVQFRFYGVGEYGEKSERPHYHYALFNFPRCKDGAKWIGRKFIPCSCGICQLITRVWGQGNIFLGDLTLDSANYVCGYVTKKLTNNSDYRQDGYTGLTNAQRLAGRHPEFARSSRMPGIASWCTDNIASKLDTYGLLTYEDMPRTLAHGSKLLPLGRYLSDKLYEKMELQFAPGEKLKRFESTLRSMLLSQAKARPDVAAASSSVDIALMLLNSQRVLDIETKQRLYSKEKRI